jgi:RNA polymerase sigma-70 factor (ECF subfamily)
MTIMDSRWLEQCREGDSLAVERLVQTYQQEVYRMAFSILDYPDDADDATQEVFLSALRALESFRENASLKTWLFSITINVCRSRMQRFNRRKKLMQILQSLFHLQGEQAHPEDEAMKNESNVALWRVIHSLDSKYRIPIVLRYYHDLPVADIAAMLGIPPGTVHSRLNHARERLRALLKEEQR